MFALFLSVIVLPCAPGLVFAAALSSATPLVQQRVTGTVTSNADGLVVPGVSVVVKGTNTGAVTDVDGKYSIAVSPDDVLVFSFVGFESQEVPVGGRTVIDISLQ